MGGCLPWVHGAGTEREERRGHGPNYQFHELWRAQHWPGCWFSHFLSHNEQQIFPLVPFCQSRTSQGGLKGLKHCLTGASMFAEPLHFSKDGNLYFMKPESFRRLCPFLHADKFRHWGQSYSGRRTHRLGGPLLYRTRLKILEAASQVLFLLGSPKLRSRMIKLSLAFSSQWWELSHPAPLALHFSGVRGKPNGAIHPSTQAGHAFD